MANKSKTYKNLFDDGYTTYHEDGSKSKTYKNLFDDGTTTYHEDGSKSKTYKNLFDDGTTTYHSDGSKSKTYKNLFDDGYTTYHEDGSKSKTYKNLFDDGTTTYHEESKKSGGGTSIFSQPVLTQQEYNDMYDKMVEEGQKYLKEKNEEHLRKRGPKSHNIGSTISKSTLDKYVTKVKYSEEEAKDYAKYAASLLYNKGIKLNESITETVDIKKVTKYGPFNLLFKKKKERGNIPTEKGWALYDCYDIENNTSDRIDSEEAHHTTMLLPDGRIIIHNYDEYYYNYYASYGKSYEKVEDKSDETTPTYAVRAYDQLGVNNVVLIDYLLDKNKIDMSIKKYLDEKPRYNDDYLKDYKKELEEERKTTKVVVDQGKFNNFHYLSLVFFVLALLAFRFIPGYLLYVLPLSIWIGLYPSTYYMHDSINPDSKGIGYEIIVILMTVATMFLKVFINDALYNNYYDNKLSVVMLGGIVVCMTISAILKIKGGAFTPAINKIKNIDHKKIAIFIIILAMARCYINNIIAFRIQAIVLIVEAILILLKKDKKTLYILAAIYLVLNIYPIYNNTYNFSLRLALLKEPGAHIFYTVLLNALSILIYNPNKKNKKSKFKHNKY